MERAVIPDHIFTLILVVVALWVLFRWGALILTLYALWYFCTEQWGYAALCFGFTCVIEAIKGGVMLIERAQGYRGPWV
jgi:hypothetical protein